ncbi:chromatin-binding/pre-rRNA-processing protein [Saccharomycopsis crataegensis]|uniref:Pre-rRNA-processing protein IPI3 n=1 Tax=Saccharomycopsis crataegensis TaxID=43959 RepID=A0AAV5QVT3_9ASCO|nr:chromatin-binding/pre-rRNA-processing protein [Saccharomycopsis crataegensis]
MEEIVTYIGGGLADDKNGENSVGFSTSIHSNTFSYAYKFANAHLNGVVSTGFMNGDNDKVFVATKNKALIQVYVHGKEAPIQKIPIPEQLSCLALTHHNMKSIDQGSEHDDTKTELQLPWLLIGGSITGKLYVWEVCSGNLLFNKSVHYQKINKIEFSNNNNFLVTSSDDSRVLVFRVLELISNSPTIKPLHAITDHTLPVTDFLITSGINNDLRLVTASADSTCRVYDLNTSKLQMTLVSLFPVCSIASDPAFRTLYLGLDNGSIRQVNLFEIDSTKKLRFIGEKSRIVTLEDDPELKWSFMAHQQQENSSNTLKITSLDVSFDGTLLVSGDSDGKVLVCDIVTKQSLKSLKPVNGMVTYLKISPTLSKNFNESENILGTKKANNYRKVPQLKRTLADSNDFNNHELSMQIPENDYHYNILNNNHKMDYDFDEYLAQVAAQESNFKASPMNAGKDESPQLQEKLDKVNEAYSELKKIHEELFEEHTKLVNQ